MNCQKEMVDDTLFCGVCGYKVEKNNGIGKVSNIWAWFLVFPSIFSANPIFTILGLNNFGIIFFGLIFINLIVFRLPLLFLDIREVSRRGYKTGFIYWVIGVISIPAYLFIRAKETKTKYHYAVVSLIIMCSLNVMGFLVLFINLF